MPIAVQALKRVLLPIAALLAVMIGIGVLLTRAATHLWPLTVEDGVNRYFAGHRTETLSDVSHLTSGIADTPRIIGVTAVVAAVVIALFFALITVERSGLYGVLKAVGASSAGLFAGVAAQAVILAVAAAAVGIAGALLLDAVIPPGALPFQVTWSRLLTSAALLVVAAVIGSAFSLRRVVRIDPATAIGASS